MAESVCVLARAKINLMLSVQARRADGYHLLDSVMQSVSLANRVTVTGCKSGITLTCDDKNVPTDRRNTAMRAAEGFLTLAKISTGADIYIEKRVPYEAGLASAGADAAGVLAAMSRLYPDAVGEGEMSALALSVGADVPFCLSGGTMRAQGIGEVLTPLPAMPQCFFVIAKGAAGVSTPEAYRAVDAAGLTPELTADRMCAALASGDLHAIAEGCENTFTAACAPQESLSLISALLENGAPGASMSGSGSAVFGIFECERDAKRALERIKAPARFAAIAAPAESGIEFFRGFGHDCG